MADDVVPDPSDHPAYGLLHTAREKLCVAQMRVPEHWREELQWALDIIDRVGSSVCPRQWSRHDQPEYPEANRG